MTDDAASLCARGRALAAEGRFADAEAAYREALRRTPDDVQAHLALGLCLRR